jgi:hypothetical protein
MDWDCEDGRYSVEIEEEPVMARCYNDEVEEGSSESVHQRVNKLLEKSGDDNRCAPVCTGSRAVNAPETFPDVPTQWLQTKKDTFVPAQGKIRSHLPPGMYTSLIEDNQLRLERINLVHDDLLQMPDSVSDQVIHSIQKFWNSQDEFVKRKQLFKRGILCYGPQGSGKTATLLLLAEDLISRGGIVFVPHRSSASLIMSIRAIRYIETDRPIIVLLEDVDEILKGESEYNILSLLDGEYQFNNVVYLATTNHPERLGPRFTNRPSRFDELIEVGLPTEKDRRFYLENKLLPVDQMGINVESWVRDTEGFSVAHLRELMVAVTCLKRDYAETLGRLKVMATKAPDTPDGYSFEAPREMGFGQLSSAKVKRRAGSANC